MTMIQELQEIVDYFADAKLHDMEQVVIDSISAIQNLEAALDLYKKERNRFKHNTPEISGAYFLAGGIGQTDTNMLPEYVEICPAYGCDWTQIYQRTDKVIPGMGG